MTLKKAIEILENLLVTYPYLSGGDESDAIELGIEALKVIQAMRKGSVVPIRVPLPGETKE